MQTIVCNVSALTVASLYYCWRSYYHRRVQREQTLRQRVAYMLWVMANSAC